MLDLTKFNPAKIGPGADIEVKEQFLSDLMSAIINGVRAARAVAGGGAPNVDLLDEYAQAMEALRMGVACASGYLKPTEDDVRNALHLVQLVREGTPSQALVEPARRAACVVTDGEELERFQSALFCLENETSRIQHIERIQDVLDLTIALFERGCRAASFTSTPTDIANVRRLREIVASEGARAEEERVRLVRELERRLPHSGSIVERETAAENLYLDR